MPEAKIENQSTNSQRIIEQPNTLSTTGDTMNATSGGHLGGYGIKGEKSKYYKRYKTIMKTFHPTTHIKRWAESGSTTQYWKNLVEAYEAQKKKEEKLKRQKEKEERERKAEIAEIEKQAADLTEGMSQVKKQQMKDKLILDRVLNTRVKKYFMLDAYGQYIKERIEFDKNMSFEDIQTKLLEISNVLHDKYFYTVWNIVLMYKDIATGKILHRSIPFDYVEYDDWIEKINSLEEGEDGGSDKYYVKQSEVLKKFDLVLFYDEPKEGHAKNDCASIFETIDLNDDTDCECLYKIFKYLKIDVSEEDVKTKYCQLTNLKTFIEDKKLSISILHNTVHFDNKNPNKHPKMPLMLASLEYMKLYYALETKNAKHIILFDTEKKHYMLMDKVQIKPNMYYSRSGRIINANETETKRATKNFITKVNENKKTVDKLKISNDRYLFFDFETVTNWRQENINMPYSVSFLDVSMDELQQLEIADKNNDRTALKSFTLITFSGFDCGKRLLQYILDAGAQINYKLIGFNSAKFDNFILLDECYKHYQKIGEDYDPHYIVNKGQILTMKINNRHSAFDLYKMAPMGSLSYMCECFKLNFKKVKGFDHADMQKRYKNNENEFKAFIEDNKQLREYNEFDVVSLALLFKKLRDGFSEIHENDEDLYIEKFMTLGQLSKTRMMKEIRANDIQLPKFYEKVETYNKIARKYNMQIDTEKGDYHPNCDIYNQSLETLYDAIKNNRVGSRCDLFNGTQYIEKLIKSMDCCSLFPYVLCIMNVYYASGNIIPVKKVEESKLITLWNVKINQTNVAVSLIPKKSEAGNDWHYKGEIETLMSTDFIKYAISVGAKITYIKDKAGNYGYQFTDKVKGCEMFNFLLEFMKKKNEQDTFKANKDAKYNPVQREVYKLSMNIIGGKMNQLINEMLTELLSEAEIKCIDPKKVNTINRRNDKFEVVHKKDMDDAIKKYNSPTYNGFLMYEYSRIYMHKYVYNMLPAKDGIYTDTDSYKMTKSMFKEWVDKVKDINVPHWKEIEEIDPRYKTAKIYNEGFKVFGSFEDEYKSHPNNLTIVNNKKDYITIDKDKYKQELEMLNYDDPKSIERFDKELNNYCHAHLKGVSMNDIIITDDIKNQLEEKMKKECKNKIDCKGCVQGELFEMYNNGRNKIKYHLIEFFKQVNDKKPVSLITFQIRRITRNSLECKIDETERYNTNIWKLQSVYTIKTIQPLKNNVGTNGGSDVVNQISN